MIRDSGNDGIPHEIDNLPVGDEPSGGRRWISPGAVPDVWRDNPEVIYEFLSRQPHYQQLCQEVAYVLKQKLKESGIEYSSITNRAKDLNSFLGKLERKKYKDPFDEIQDFAGVRVVCLYPSDLQRIEDLIKNEFELVEKVDKYRKNRSDRFGYMAVHFLVKLGSDFSGARYDHLKNLVCEIQTRTVLQHAWALIDQHLLYKKKSSVPTGLSNRINDLSRVLEEADRQFEMIRRERAHYIKTLEKTKSKDAFLTREINPDSFKVFCEISFPDYSSDQNMQSYYTAFKWIDLKHNASIGDLQTKVKKSLPKLDDIIDDIVIMFEKQGRKMEKLTNLHLVHICLALSDRAYRARASLSREFLEILEKYEDKSDLQKKSRKKNRAD